MTSWDLSTKGPGPEGCSAALPCAMLRSSLAERQATVGAWQASQDEIDAMIGLFGDGRPLSVLTGQYSVKEEE